LTDFSKTLTRLARLCDKSEYDLAALTGLDRAFIHRLMSGEKNPSSATVVRLAIALPTCKQLAEKHPTDVPNVLGLLLMAQLCDATAKSEQSRQSLD